MKLDYAVINSKNLYLKIDINENPSWDIQPSLWKKEVAEIYAQKFGGTPIYLNPIDLVTSRLN